MQIQSSMDKEVCSSHMVLVLFANCTRSSSRWNPRKFEIGLFELYSGMFLGLLMPLVMI